MIKRNLVIIGNWKMNKTILDSTLFFTSFKKLYKKENKKIPLGTKFGFAVPSIFISLAKQEKINPQMVVACQNIHQKEFGAYTGEISAKMIKNIGANAVIIGHSERRKHFGETNKDVNEKTISALDKNLLPVVCVGETLEERNSNKWEKVVKKQIEFAFKNISKEHVKKVIIAYEPIWAIGTGIVASTKDAQNACKFIRDVIKKNFSEEVALKIIIQYGGSVKPNNIVNLMKQKDIDGALVGGASLDPRSFMKLLTLNN